MSTEIILLLRRPSLIDHETLYMRCFESGVAGIGENHSTYARYVGGIVSREGNTSSIFVLGISKMTCTWAIRRPNHQQLVLFQLVVKSDSPLLPWPCGLLLTRTVSKRAGMIRPRKSFCSGRTQATSTMSVPLVNFIL